MSRSPQESDPSAFYSAYQHGKRSRWRMYLKLERHNQGNPEREVPQSPMWQRRTVEAIGPFSTVGACPRRVKTGFVVLSSQPLLPVGWLSPVLRQSFRSARPSGPSRLGLPV